MLYARRVNIFASAIALSVLIIAAYIYFYQASPFDDAWTNFILNSLTSLSALFAASAVFFLFRNYTVEDRPYRIWQHFTIGMALWFIAEVVWGIWAQIEGSVPSPSVPDIFWVVGMFFFTFGMQYQLKLFSSRFAGSWLLIAFWVAIAILTAGVLLVFSVEFTAENYMEYFYAVSDFGIGLLALWLFIQFSGGVMARPWIGMFVFGISDAMYASVNASGLYAFSIEEGNSLSLLVDTSYIIAYLILALAFFAQFLLIKYGPEAFQNPHKS